MTTQKLSDTAGSSLRSKINFYKQKSKEIEDFLIRNPNEWGRFQSEFNYEVDSVFREIMNFEKENVQLGNEEKVYKLKQLFVKNLRGTFERGDYINWSLKKPYGYAGDYKIIEDIYQNYPATTGFERLFDNYFMMSAISIAVRNRKNDFKRFITEFCSNTDKSKVSIMALASGPAKEIREFFFENKELSKKVEFDCYDNDEHSIKFASKETSLSGLNNVKFHKENAIRIAFRKDVNNLINKKYDLIYSTGLFDYFEERLAVKLIHNLRVLLNPDGKLIISDVRDKYSNPSVHFMEWVGEWELVYRDDENFREIFRKAGFEDKDLMPQYEQQGILQYINATKNN